MTAPRYQLPNKNHDVIEDIQNLRETFCAIDKDFETIKNKTAQASEIVEETKSKVVYTNTKISNTEIQDVLPNRYLTINKNGDGFICVEGGGNSDGTTGQYLIKKDESNFSSCWGDISKVSKNGMTILENSGDPAKKNEVHIYKNTMEIENNTQLPKVELTTSQSRSDIEVQANESVIFT